MTKYIHCNFSNKQEENNFEVKIGGVKLPISKFKYLGSILQNDRKINKDFTHIIQVGWLKSQKTSRVICVYHVNLCFCLCQLNLPNDNFFFGEAWFIPDIMALIHRSQGC